MPRMDRDEPLYMISVAARLCELHPQTLRMYERMGLVRPARIGAKNRMYSESDVERLRQIQRLTHELGVNLAGVEVILDLLEKLQHMREDMESEIERLRVELESQARGLEK